MAGCCCSCCPPTTNNQLMSLRACSIPFFFFSYTFTFPASGQAMVTGVVHSPPRFLPSIFIAHRAQQSHCSSISYRLLLTHALALSASQFVLKKKSQRNYTSMHSTALELTKLTYTKLEDNLIRHRGNRLHHTCSKPMMESHGTGIITHGQSSRWGPSSSVTRGINSDGALGRYGRTARPFSCRGL